jgi:hypothetical protein
VLATKDLHYDRAFVVDEESLRRLHKIVIEAEAEATYSVKLSDGVVLHPTDFEEIFGLPNSPTRSIQNITTRVAYQGPIRVEFSLDSSAYTNTMDFSVIGEEKDVAFISDQLEEWAGSVSQWYSPICAKNPVTLAVGPISWTVGMISLIFGLTPDFPWPKLKPFVLLLAAVSLLLAMMFNRVVRYVFPRGIFAIGGGITRLRSYQSRQKVFSIGTILAPIVTVLLSILANRLSR